MSNPGKIFSLIPRVMGEIKAIGKDQTNKFQNYTFRGIDDLYNAVHPVLVKHGVFCVPQVTKADHQTHEGKEGKPNFRALLQVSHRFYAEDGSYVEVITMGEGLDTSDKATNKAMSAAMKYAFIELFSIPTADIEDSDRDHTEIDRLTEVPRPAPAHQIRNVTPVKKPF